MGGRQNLFGQCPNRRGTFQKGAPLYVLVFHKSTRCLLRKGLIYFPDFCQIVLERFRENEAEEEEFRKSMFKVGTYGDKVADMMTRCAYRVTNRKVM